MCVREEGLWWVVGQVILQELLGTPERTLLSPQPPEEHSRLKDPRMRVLSELERDRVPGAGIEKGGDREGQLWSEWLLAEVQD